MAAWDGLWPDLRGLPSSTARQRDLDAAVEDYESTDVMITTIGQIDTLYGIKLERVTSDHDQICWKCDSLIAAGDEHILITSPLHSEDHACLWCFEKLKASIRLIE